MSAGCRHRVASIVVGLMACAARADLVGGTAVTVTSATGFVPVTWSEPTNGYGYGGSTRGRGDAWVPFAGWVDFGLLGGQRVTVDWDFSPLEPHRWTSWTLTRLGGDSTPIAGITWDGSSWRSLGSALLPAGAAGSSVVQLGIDGGRADYRLSFSGISINPESGGVGLIGFAVPAPASVALVGLAVAASRRRREGTN